MCEMCNLRNSLMSCSRTIENTTEPKLGEKGEGRGGGMGEEEEGGGRRDGGREEKSGEGRGEERGRKRGGEGEE